MRWIEWNFIFGFMVWYTRNWLQANLSYNYILQKLHITILCFFYSLKYRKLYRYHCLQKCPHKPPPLHLRMIKIHGNVITFQNPKNLYERSQINKNEITVNSGRAEFEEAMYANFHWYLRHSRPGMRVSPDAQGSTSQHVTHFLLQIAVP